MALVELGLCVMGACWCFIYLVAGACCLARHRVSCESKTDVEKKKGETDVEKKKEETDVEKKKEEISKRFGRSLIETNPYEDVILGDVINPDNINVKFESIGGLEKVKQALIELVILPLWRPKLFSQCKLLGPQKGVLLYGPPGTGKTMLAKAIAKESGAIFINVRMSNLMSKWVGEAHKLVAAVFSLAYKLQPSIIFIDEVDSFLGQRRSTDNESMAIMKIEFMALWNGFTTDRKGDGSWCHKPPK